MIELAGNKKKKKKYKKISDPFLYSKAGINQYDTYRGHHGMVTGIDFHPLHGPVDFSDLFLTSSVDWTVKLWRAKVNIPIILLMLTGFCSVYIQNVHSSIYRDSIIFI